MRGRYVIIAGAGDGIGEIGLLKIPEKVLRAGILNGTPAGVISAAVNCFFTGDSMPPKLRPEIITAAIEGFESQKRRIDDQIAELRALLVGGTTETTATLEAPGRKRRKLSAASRRRMREAQQRRWAKVRGESEPSAPAKPELEKPKRRISKEGMARIIAATKKRWRLQKAAAKTKSVAKKTAPARKKAAVKKAVVKAPQVKAARKRAAVKKPAAVNMTPPAPTPTVTEAVAP
jgi:hypothetical protein